MRNDTPAGFPRGPSRLWSFDAPFDLGYGTLAAGIFAWWLFLVAPLWAVSLYARYAPTRSPLSPAMSLWLGTADALAWALICLAALVLVRVFPIESGRRLLRLAAHAAAGLVLVTLRGVIVNVLFIQAIPARGRYPLSLHVVTGIASDLVVYLLILSAAYGYDYFCRYREREISSMLMEHELTKTQLQMLKMQLHPHFLFNTLHGISSLMYQDVKAADRMLARLGDLLRQTLQISHTQLVSLDEELELLRPYLEIERIRLGNRLSVSIDPGGAGDVLVPHMILQPLVENAIRHGIAPNERGGHLSIEAALRGERLLLCVRDTGAGIGSSTPQQGHGIGLINTETRLRHLYGADYDLVVTSGEDRGFAVEIAIPRQTEGSLEVSGVGAAR